MIRLATQEDIPELLRMSESFFNASGYAELTTFHESDSESTLNNIIEQGWLLTDVNHAMLGFVFFPMFMNS